MTKTAPIINVIGNKLDLVEQNPINRKVTQERVDALCKAKEVEYIETSALFEKSRMESSFMHLIKGNIV